MNILCQISSLVVQLGKIQVNYWSHSWIWHILFSKLKLLKLILHQNHTSYENDKLYWFMVRFLSPIRFLHRNLQKKKTKIKELNIKGIWHYRAYQDVDILELFFFWCLWNQKSIFPLPGLYPITKGKNSINPWGKDGNKNQTKTKIKLTVLTWLSLPTNQIGA